MFSKRVRRMTLVGPLERRIAVHTAGYPLPVDSMLPPADVVLVVSDATGGAMLFRYSAHGEFCGDTPHGSVEEAQQQAEAEYGEALLLPWQDVPAEIGDAHAFAIQYAAEQLDERE
jgi:hypothetical protein